MKIAHPPQASAYKASDPSASIPTIFEQFDLSKCRIDEEHDYEYKVGADGIYQIFSDKHADPINTPILSLKKYYQDQEFILSICSEG